MLHILKIQRIIFFLLAVIAIPVSANISVKLTSPNWEFLLKNEPWKVSEIQLSSSERSFAQEVQRLFAEDNKTAVIKKLASRDYQDDSSALLLLRGQIHLKFTDYVQAEKVLTSALEQAPNYALAHRSLSIVYLFNHQYEKALQHLTNTLQFGVADAQVYGQLAYVHLQLNQAASAVAGYQYAMLLEPNNMQWKQGLLYALTETHAFDQAQAIVDEMLQKSPDNSQLWLQRGQIALNQGRTQQAISSIEAALQLGVNDANNIAFAAQLHIQSGSPKRAVELLGKHSNQLISANKMNELAQIASWLVFEKNWQQLSVLINAIDLKHKNVSAEYRSHFSVYQAKMALSGYRTNIKTAKPAARKYLKTAIEMDPTNGDALLTLAHVLQDMNHHDQAVNYYIRAQALSEYTERALLGRSQLAIDNKKYSEALRLLRQVIQRNPTRSDILANIKSLENLVRSES